MTTWLAGIVKTCFSRIPVCECKYQVGILPGDFSVEMLHPPHEYALCINAVVGTFCWVGFSRLESLGECFTSTQVYI